MNDVIMTSQDWYDSLIGGLCDEDEAREEVEEMRKAKVGTIKPNCWEKIAEDEYIIFEM